MVTLAQTSHWFYSIRIVDDTHDQILARILRVLHMWLLWGFDNRAEILRFVNHVSEVIELIEDGLEFCGLCWDLYCRVRSYAV